MLKPFQILMPPTVLYGSGCLENMGPKVKPLGRKALVVTDEIMYKVGYVDKVKEILESQGIQFVVYDKANTEPTTIFVDEGLKMYKENECDFLVAIGGGSPIDTAKAIGAMVTNPGKLTDYMGIDKMIAPAPPIVAIATTSGTGSEVTKFTIIADVENDVKMLIGSPYIMATVAVDDPLLTMSVPPKTTAATGIDALTHAIEAYISVKSQPFTDVVALSAIRRIAKYLRRAWSNGDDLEARSEMMLAAMEAGIAFNNSSVTIVHGMSRPIGANFHVPHGISNAVLLPDCMEFAMMGAPEKFAVIAEAMGENVTGMSAMKAARVAVEAIKQLNDDLRIPSISGLGIDKEKFMALVPKMAQDALNSGSPGNTPRKASKEDIIEIYKKAL
jgi:1,3-propanediol dehydrogenase